MNYNIIDSLNHNFKLIENNTTNKLLNYNVLRIQCNYQQISIRVHQNLNETNEIKFLKTSMTPEAKERSKKRLNYLYIPIDELVNKIEIFLNICEVYIYNNIIYL